MAILTFAGVGSAFALGDEQNLKSYQSIMLIESEGEKTLIDGGGDTFDLAWTR